MSAGKTKPKRDAINATKHKICDFQTRALGGMAKWEITDAQRERVDAIIGKNGTTKQPMLSDFPARLKASTFFIRKMHRHWKGDGGNPKRRYFFLTFIDDMGNTSDRDPEVNVGALKRKVDKATRDMDLDAVGAIEVQAILNYPQKGHGRTLMFHAHAIGWTDKRFDHKAAAKRLNKKRSWNNAFGAKPIVIQPVTDLPGNIERLSHYILKVPHDVKNRRLKAGTTNRYQLMQTTKGYRPELALRIVEGLSQIGIAQAIFGVGDGKLISRALRKRLLEWHHRRTANGTVLPEDFDVAGLWRDLRKTNGSENYGPYRFLTGGERPKSVHPSERGDGV